jgi:O-antigen/teichoic acid export membrane protein
VTRWPGLSGTVGLAASRALGLAMTSAVTVTIARVLGPSLFGAYASAAAILAVVLILGNLGIDQLYLRWDIELEELRSRSLQLGAATMGLSFLGAMLWPGLSVTVRVCIALLGAAAGAEDLKLAYILEPQRQLMFLRRGRRELSLQAIVVVSSLIAVAIHPSPPSIAAAVLIGSLIGLIPAARHLGWWRRILEPGVLELTRKAFPYCLAGAIYTAYFQIDAAILASFRPTAEVGQYRAAFSLVFALILFPVAMNNDTMLARYYAASLDALAQRAVLRRFAVASLVGGVVAVAGVELLGPVAVHILFGSSYEPAVELLRILGLALLPHFLNSWAGNSLVGRGLVRLVVRIQLALLTVNVVGNLILIPSTGARAAAWMTVATETVGLALYGLAIARADGVVNGPRAAGDG